MIAFPSWARNEDGALVPVTGLPTIPPGIYTPIWASEGYGWEPKPLVLDEIIIPESGAVTEILNRIKVFFAAKPKYERLKLIHKMSLLLTGAPGHGKTTVVGLVANQFVEMGGVVLLGTPPTYIAEALKSLRRVEPEREALVIIEDVDDLDETSLLSILDGEDGFDHVFFVLTTNSEENISKRLGRVGRIDDRVEICPPDYDFRRKFFERKIQDGESFMVDNHATLSAGMTFAQMRELVVLTQVRGLCLSEAVVKVNAASRPDEN
jgi:SpoVK/Ycf46/Vps4 family AAA+-type ATPase